MRLVREGHYEDGIAELVRAYETLPHPSVLSNIARAYALAGRYQDSIIYFERYLETGPADAAAIQTNLRELRAAVAASEAEVPTPPPPPPPPPPPAPTPRPDLTLEREALRTAARELDELARLTQSTTTASRAAELRRIADLLEQPPTDASGASSTPPPPTEQVPTEPPVAPSQTEEPPLIADLAMQEPETAEDAAYAETVEGASRSVSSPLDAPASTTIITRQDIHLSGANSIEELLRRAAGVNVIMPTPNSGFVAMRGFNRTSSPRVLMLINGRSTYIDSIGAPFWDYQTIQVEDIERIEVIRGPASVLYGPNGFSGIVNVVLRSPGGRLTNEMSAGVGNASSIRGHGSVTGRAGPFVYRLHAGYQQGDRFTLPYSRDRVDVVPPVSNIDLGFRHTNAGGQIRARFGRTGTVTVESGVAYSDRLTFFGTGAFRDFVATYTTAFGSATLASDIGRLRVFANHHDLESFNVLADAANADMRNDAVDVEGSVRQRFHLVVDHDLHVGVNYRFNAVQWNYLAQSVFRRHQFGAFFEDTMRAGDHVRIVGSLRIDQHPFVDRLMFSPRIALVLRPDESRSVRVTAGSAFRTPSYQDAYIDFSVATPISAVSAIVGGGRRSPGGMNPEQIRSFEVGYIDQSWRFLSFEASAYYNYVTDLIQASTTPRLFTLAQVMADPNDALGFSREDDTFSIGATSLENGTDQYHAIGGELAIRSNPVEGLDLYANYSVNAIREHAVSGENRWDRASSRHVGNFGVQYRSRVGVDVASDFHVSSRQVWTDLVSTSSGAELKQLPVPTFYFLNARAAYRFDDDRFEVGVSGYNITRNRQRQHPFGQPIDMRIMGTFAVRMGER